MEDGSSWRQDWSPGYEKPWFRRCSEEDEAATGPEGLGNVGPEGSGLADGRGARLGSALQMTDRFKICKIKSPSPPSILKYRTLAARSLCSRQTCCLYLGHVEWDHLRNLGTGGLAEVGRNRKHRKHLE